MDIKAEEISKIIREQIGSFAVDVDVAEVGSIVSIGDGIARVHGVENAMEGDTVKRTGRIISVPVGEQLLGRVVNALGQPIDGKGPIVTKEFAPIERLAPGVVDRQSVKEPLQTGLN